MEELLPGILHWTAHRDTIGVAVHSYWVRDAGAVIDPMEPEAGLDAFAAAPPSRVLLTNRHHYRHADRFVAAFGCSVHGHEAGLHAFAGTDRVVEGFAFGAEVAPGIVAREVGVLTPEETALHVLGGGGAFAGALAFADALIRRRDGALGFVPDGLLGEEPEAVKAGLRAVFARLAALGPDALLLAHGEPLAHGGAAALRALGADAGEVLAP
jgi:hypothetical protein